MDVTTQQMNSARLYATVAVQQAPQSVQDTKGKGATNSPKGDDITSLSPVTDQVRLSLEARQAYENSLSTPPVNDLQEGNAVANNETASPVVDGGQPATEVDPVAAEVKQPDTAAEESSAAKEPKQSDENSDKVHLTADEQQQILELELRDREVQVHEAAHAAVGGQYAGAPSLTYETGPDGKRYAVSGEVNVDMSEISGDPAATMKKADVIRAAALAPAQPSSQDRNVAAQAAQMKAEAQTELMAEAAEAGNNMVENSATAGSLPTVAAETVSDVTAPQFSGAIA